MSDPEDDELTDPEDIDGEDVDWKKCVLKESVK